MATYLPNVKRYVSKTKSFTPDFKFLSDALDKRQDRYDTNYKKMNNLYGLSSSDFASGGGIEESADGLLHRFVKLKLQGVPGTKQSGTDNFYAYYKKKWFKKYFRRWISKNIWRRNII